MPPGEPIDEKKPKVEAENKHSTYDDLRLVAGLSDVADLDDFPPLEKNRVSAIQRLKEKGIDAFKFLGTYGQSESLGNKYITFFKVLEEFRPKFKTFVEEMKTVRAAFLGEIETIPETPILAELDVEASEIIKPESSVPEKEETPVQIIEAPKANEAYEKGREIENILLVLNYVSPKQEEKFKGGGWVLKRNTALEKIKNNGGKLGELLNDRKNFTTEAGDNLFNGIVFMTEPLKRESDSEGWERNKKWLEEKAGIDTEKTINLLSELYEKGNAALVTLSRMVGPGEMEKYPQLKTQLELVNKYLEDGVFPHGWGKVKSDLKETVGVSVEDFERMREIERKKKEIGEKRKKRSERKEMAKEKKTLSEIGNAEDLLREKERRTKVEDDLIQLAGMESNNKDREALLETLETSGVKIRKFLEDMEKTSPGRQKDIMTQLRAVVEVWRMSEEKRAGFPKMARVSGLYAQVLGVKWYN
jgi:hypothetical protein